MDFGTIMLACVCGGAILGGLFGCFTWLKKIKEVKQKFQIDKGMKFDVILEKLGAPITKTEKNNKIFCAWQKDVDVKATMIVITFENNIATKISLK